VDFFLLLVLNTVIHQRFVLNEYGLSSLDVFKRLPFLFWSLLLELELYFWVGAAHWIQATSYTSAELLLLVQLQNASKARSHSKFRLADDLPAELKSQFPWNTEAEANSIRVDLVLWVDESKQGEQLNLVLHRNANSRVSHWDLDTTIPRSCYNFFKIFHGKLHISEEIIRADITEPPDKFRYDLYFSVGLGKL